jgi:hypothetical protein
MSLCRRKRFKSGQKKLPKALNLRSKPLRISPTNIGSMERLLRRRPSCFNEQSMFKFSPRLTHWAPKFSDSRECLGDKLGPILFQLPPTFKKDCALLQAFCSHLPSGCKVCVSFLFCFCPLCAYLNAHTRTHAQCTHTCAARCDLGHQKTTLERKSKKR